MATSQNGYTANNRSLIETITIPGTERRVALRKGAPGQLLAHWAGWFDKNIESVDGGQLDDWGYAERPIRGSQTTLSNHASGTALDLNAPRHPLGKRGTFTNAQITKIRAELKRYEGAIRWGGDYRNRADEMHFEINADVATCERVLKKVSGTPEPDPGPQIPEKEPGMNDVQYARLLVTEAAKRFDGARKNGKPRSACRAAAKALRLVLGWSPKK